jgi:hypothetical protein
MVFRFLEINWAELIEQGNVVWAGIITIGGGVLVNVATFIKTTFSGKKFTKVSDFAVVADKSMKFAKSEITEVKKEVMTLMKSEVVAPLLEEIQQLKADNTKLANLAVTALSLTPIPLEQKKALLPVLSTIGTVSKEATAILQANIAKQENDKIEEISTVNTLNETINEI